MKTVLEHYLTSLLPLSTKTVVDRRRSLFGAVDELYEISKRQGGKKLSLSSSDEELAQSVVAALLYEYMNDGFINGAARSPRQTGYTILSEWGARIPLTQVARASTTDTVGLGVSIRKLNDEAGLRPLLFSVLRCFLEDKEMFFHLKDIDRFTEQESSNEQNKIRHRFLPPFLRARARSVPKKKVALVRNQVVFVLCRLLAFLDPPFDIWLVVWNRLQAIELPRRSDLYDLMFSIAGHSVIEDFDASQIVASLNTSNVQHRQANRYLLYGKFAQQDNQFVKLLLDELEYADPMNMDIVHALIIAASKNPHAVKAYIDVKGDRMKYPYAMEDEFIVAPYLDNMNIEAFDCALQEASRLPSINSSPDSGLSRPLAAQRLLELSPGLETSAKEYLLKLIQDPAQQNLKYEAIEFLRQKQNVESPDLKLDEAIYSLLVFLNNPISLIQPLPSPDPLQRTMRGATIRCVTELALSAPGEMQIEFLQLIIESLNQSDRILASTIMSLTQDLLSTEEENNKVTLFFERFFDEEQVSNSEWFDQIKHDLFPASGDDLFVITTYLLDVILYGKVVFVTTLIDYAGKFTYLSEHSHPAVRSVIGQVKNRYPNFFRDHYSTSVAFEEESFERLESTLYGIDNLLITELQTPTDSETEKLKLTRASAEYLFDVAFAENQDAFRDDDYDFGTGETWVKQIRFYELEQLPTPLIDDSTFNYVYSRIWAAGVKLPVPSLKTRFLSQTELYRINIFATRIVLNSPFLAEEHVRHILKVASSKKLEDSTRTYMIMGLANVCSTGFEKTIIRQLSTMLSDSSHFIVGASILMIWHFVDRLQYGVEEEFFLQICEAIQEKCVSPTRRNTNGFGGHYNIHGLCVSDIAVAALLNMPCTQ